MKSLYKYSLTIGLTIMLSQIKLSAVAYDNSSKQYQVRTLTLLRENEKQLTVLMSRVKYLMENSAAQNQQIQQLKQSIKAEKQNNQKFKREISVLKEQLDDDRKQIQKTLDNIIDKVANETTTAINSALKKTDKRGSSKSNKGGPIGTGEFVEYKVQPGATLSAIAKAYNVTVNSIRKSNKLNNDFIRIGQILYIPKQ